MADNADGSMKSLLFLGLMFALGVAHAAQRDAAQRGRTPPVSLGLRRNGNCNGRCTSMVSCVVSGGRPEVASSACATGVLGVCCTNWSARNGRNVQVQPEVNRRQPPPPRPPPSGPPSLPVSAIVAGSSIKLAPIPPSTECGLSRLAQRRILGGLDAGYGQFPWTAHISIKGPNIDKECVGTLVSKRWIVTAGHCTQYCLGESGCASEVAQSELTYSVLVGEYDQWVEEPFPPQKIIANDVIRHPEYINVDRVRENGVVETEPRFDVALLRLQRDVVFGTNVAPICLPSISSENVGLPGALGTVIGWGRVGRFDDAPHSHVLQAATLPVLTDEQCLEQTGLAPFSDQVCAGDVNADSTASACPGDSGGALQEQDDAGRWTMVGVVSNGPRVCGTQPVVFHRVTASVGWIRLVISSRDGEKLP